MSTEELATRLREIVSSLEAIEWEIDGFSTNIAGDVDAAVRYCENAVGKLEDEWTG